MKLNRFLPDGSVLHSKNKMSLFGTNLTEKTRSNNISNLQRKYKAVVQSETHNRMNLLRPEPELTAVYHLS